VSRLIRSVNALPLALGLLALVLGACSPQQTDTSGAIVVLPTTGTVDNVMAGYLKSGIDRAASDGAVAVIVELDTPGGSLDATQDIVQTLLDPPLPVIVWVGPPGAWAASAGTFITLSANLAYMAPGTNIGAASPVDSSGGDIGGTLGEKVKNNAIASITAIAKARGRDVDAAVATVESAASYDAAEAVSKGLVNGMAATLEDVRREADGETVTVNGAEQTLALAGAPLVELEMNPFQQLLHLLSDPNIAFILFTLGFYGLLFELQNPNFVTGTLGALAIILAFIGFGSLPLNIAGLILIGLGLVLLALEPTVTSHGLLTIGGLMCITLGAFALYTEPGTPGAPDIAVAYPVIATVVVTLGLVGTLIAIGVLRSRRMRATAGMVGVAVTPGTLGEVRRSLDPIGSVYAAGEEWTARTEDERPLQRGTPVRVIRIEGLTAIVEPLTEGLAT
jgi:membrane-bound serine protease (ClpP class)